MCIRLTLCFGFVAAFLIGTASIAAAQQPTFRIQGRIITTSGTPVVGARVQTDATAGVQGAGFVEAKDFTATTNNKGEWSVLGVTRGVWIFEFSAAGFVPNSVVVPIHVTQTQVGWQINWRLSVPLIGLDELRALEGDGAALADLLAPHVSDAKMLSRDDALKIASEAQTMRLDGAGLCAAGGIALLGRGVSAARTFYDRAEKMRPADTCGPLGVASTSLMLSDIDAAIGGYSRARAATNDQWLKRVASAAIEDLQRIVVKPRHGVPRP
jgi:hypothetical protein